MKIHFYGVGAALNESMDNTNFLIEDGKSKLQVDCTGGLSLAQRVKRGETHFENLFITHKHTDHFLGLFNLLRMIRSGQIQKLNIYCNNDVEKSAKIIAEALGGSASKFLFDKTRVNFINIEKNNKIKIGDLNLISINLFSNKIPQHGFNLELNGKRILFFGDEAINILGRDDLEEFYGADYLICEALLTYEMSIEGGGNIDNIKMSHITAKEAGKIATKLGVKNLVLVHTYEKFEGDRQELLTLDAKQEFNGNIIIPNSGDIIEC